jgi:hypothetical protein
MTAMLHLHAQYYVPKEHDRRREIDECFKRNVNNPLVKRFTIFFEKSDDLNLIESHSKVRKIVIPRRLTYRDWLEATADVPLGELSILINSDIYLNESVSHLLENIEEIKSRRLFIALSRYNPFEFGLELNKNSHWTQDLWGLVQDGTPFPKQLLQEVAFELGQPGCDNKIAYVMHSYGYTLTNPCLKVETVHLQSSVERAYDPKLNKLLGLQTFVYPTESVLESSYLEFNLLTRNLNDLNRVLVNHWINDCPSYSLNIDPNKNFKSTLPVKPPVKIERKVYTNSHENNSLVAKLDLEPDVENEISKFKSQNLEDGLIDIQSFISSEYQELVKFNDQFCIYADTTSYYLYDAMWPYVKRIVKNQWDHLEFDKLNPELFIQAFAPAVLEFESLKIDDEIDYPEDIYFWQYPCRTEGDAAKKHKSKISIHFDKKEVNIYIPLPWATFIDKKIFPTELIGLLSRRVNAIRNFLASYNLSLNVHTVCQHIHYERDLLSHLEKLGVTDLWTSHKTLNQNQMAGIRLHSWHLYAVNYLEVERSEGLIFKSIKEKKYLASFVGAYMKHYLTEVRLNLRQLKDRPGFYIDLNDEWHFNQFVYDYQVSGKDYIQVNKTHDVIRYNQVLSDSIFSLCPSGAGPNSLRLWESLAIGAIPVILSDTYELPKLSKILDHESFDWVDAVIIYPESELQDLEQHLRSFSLEQLNLMQAVGQKIFKKINQMTCF